MFQPTKEWVNKVNLSSFELENFFQFVIAWLAREKPQLDATTMFTYSHANTPLGKSERAYYLSYFIKRNGYDFMARSDQKEARLKIEQCRLNGQRFDFVLLTNTVQREKMYERWFLSLFRFLDRGCKCMGTSVCWWIHMFEYSANDFTTSSRSFCFSSKCFVRGQRLFLDLTITSDVWNFTQNFISFDKYWL